MDSLIVLPFLLQTRIKISEEEEGPVKGQWVG
jgi:hypothetical protein